MTFGRIEGVQVMYSTPKLLPQFYFNPVYLVEHMTGFLDHIRLNLELRDRVWPHSAIAYFQIESYSFPSFNRESLWIFYKKQALAEQGPTRVPLQAKMVRWVLS